MANDLNNCSFIGRLGADPEVRYSQGGTAIANFRIACGWKGKDKEGTEWIPVSCFGRLAEIVGEYLTKGSQVYVSGRFRTRKWQDKEGNDRYTSEVVADTMQMLGSKSEARQDSTPRQQASPEPSLDPDDDIPF